MFLYSKWLELSINTRNAIAQFIGLPRRGSVEVVGNTIRSDGYNIKELEAALSPENLKKHLITDEEDSQVLWNLLVNKFEPKASILPPVTEGAPIPTTIVKTPEVVTAPVNKGGRPKGSKTKK